MFRNFSTSMVIIVKKITITITLIYFSILSFSINVKDSLSNSAAGKIFLDNAITVNSTLYNTVHDSQILTLKYNNNHYVFVLFCSLNPNKYIMNIYNSSTNKLLLSSNLLSDIVLGSTQWAPRFFQTDSTTVRITFTINKVDVYYRDFSLKTFKFNSPNRLKVRYELKNGTLSDYVNFTLPVFIQHINNCLHINLNSSEFNSFSDRSLLINGTDQPQYENSKYYLTAEVLSDNFKFGDCGGISCLIESQDLTNWTLKKPVYAGPSVSSNRNHEMSMTYLNNEWHGLSRYNTDSINGYMSWSSLDGDIWRKNGLAELPNAIRGYRNSVFVIDNKKENACRQIAIIAYQKYDEQDTLKFIEHHSQRKSIGICLTTDFKKFYEILEISDPSFKTYPSICMDGDILFMSWSSGVGYFLEKIKYSKINIRTLINSSEFALLNTSEFALEDYKSGIIHWQFSREKQDWSDIIGENDQTLRYIILECGFIRARVEDCNSLYYSEIVEIQH